jgi:hypothetical protein
MFIFEYNGSFENLDEEQNGYFGPKNSRERHMF